MATGEDPFDQPLPAELSEVFAVADPYSLDLAYFLALDLVRVTPLAGAAFEDEPDSPSVWRHHETQKTFIASLRTFGDVSITWEQAPVSPERELNTPVISVEIEQPTQTYVFALPTDGEYIMEVLFDDDGHEGDDGADEEFEAPLLTDVRYVTKALIACYQQVIKRNNRLN